MILFSNCKINLGLDVIRKRTDGYHDLESVMFPVYGLCDAIEIICCDGEGVEFSSSGITVDCADDKNLCVKAYNLIKQRYTISGVKIHLHKVVPFGAGLGGGSSNAVTVLKILNKLFSLNLTTDQLEAFAAELGSDTIFFVKNTPALISGRGEKVTPIELNLSEYYLALVKPEFSVGTAQAYAGIVPKIPLKPIDTIIKGDINLWKSSLKNDFEKSVFKIYPKLELIKESLYRKGAIYAAMSGSGSTVYGIFKTLPKLEPVYDNAFLYTCKM